MNEYDQQAQDFLEKFNLKVSASYVSHEPPLWDEKQEWGVRRKYRVRVSRKDTGKSLTFNFWDSIAHDQEGKRPTAYDLLASISAESYVYEDFDDFCSAFGYDTDSRKAHATWQRCSRFARRINRFFTEGELEELRQIS